MNKNRILTAFVLLLVTILLVACGDNGEQEEGMPDDYPDKPINVVVAYDAGGGTDTGARLLTGAAEEVSDHTFVVENRPGAGGETGYNQLAQSDSDGYTIGFINLPTFVSLPEERSTKYSVEDVEPIMLHVYDPAVLFVNPDNEEIQTLDGFLKYAEENPGELTVANNGAGASNHIIAADFENEANIDINHVPFDGSNELLTSVRSGETMAGVAKISEVAQLLDDELIAVASMTEEPLDNYPDVPTMQENNIDVIGASGRGIVAPKGTDPEIINYLQEVFQEAMETEDHIDKAEKISLPLRHMNAEEFGEYIEESDKINKEIMENIDL